MGKILNAVFRVLSIILSIATVLMSINPFSFVTVNASGNLTDEQFYGKWDGTKWATVGKLKYNYMEDNVKVLALVETEAKRANGDYTKTKEAFLTYMRNRNNLTVPGTLTENKGFADLALRDTFSGPGTDYLQDTINIRSSFSSVNTNVLKPTIEALNGSNQISFMLMGAYKDNTIVEICSKENPDKNYIPALEVKFEDGSIQTINPNKDTYIIGGSTTTNGLAQTLLVRDSGAPFDAKSYRTYLNFDLTMLTKKSAPITATLKLYGKNDSSSDKLLNLFVMGDSSWDELTYNWQSILGNIYSWNTITGGTTWTGPSKSDAQYAYVINRFNFAQPMIVEHLKNPTETVYTSKLVDLMMDFLTDHPAGYNRTLETGERESNWVPCYHYLKNTTSLNSNFNSEIVKFMWQEANFLSDPANFRSNSNWGIIQTNGFIKITTYFPEFTQSEEWFNLANDRILTVAKNENLSDFSFIESTTTYAELCIILFTESLEFVTINNKSLKPEMESYLVNMCKFLIDSSFSNRYDTNYGDSNYSLNTETIIKVGNIFNNDYLKYYGTFGFEGKKPHWNSKLYQIGKYATMRSGWDIDDMYLRVSNNNKSAHGHNDLLSIVAYAYGKPLLVDSGRYSYNNAASPIAVYCRSTTLAHNTIEVSGTAQTKTAVSNTNYWNSNNSIDFYEGITYANVLSATSTQTAQTLPHTRSVTYIKNGFWIVSDKLVNSTSNEYLNNFKLIWHYMPNANPTIDETTKKVSTNFSIGPNLQVVPADPEDIDIVDPAIMGYYSENYGVVQYAPYTTFSKTGRNSATFDTILYPTKEGETKNVSINRLNMYAVTSDTATAMKINIDGNNGDYGYYYLSHEENPTTARNYGNYSFNGKMAYTQTDNNGNYKSASIIDGTTLINNTTKIIDYQYNIKELSIEWNNQIVNLSGSGLYADPNKKTAIAIYAPNATTVKLNNEDIRFAKNGDYIYAVGIASPSTININGVISLLPTDDTKTLSDYATTNYGADTSLNTRWITSKSAYSYLKFNLKDTDGVNINTTKIKSAKLKMYMNASTSTTDQPVAAYPVTDENWSENTATWASPPASNDETEITTTSVGASENWYEWDLTSYIKNDPDNIVSVKLNPTTIITSSGENKLFNSKEASTNKPELLITLDTKELSKLSEDNFTLSTIGQTPTSWSAVTADIANSFRSRYIESTDAINQGQVEIAPTVNSLKQLQFDYYNNNSEQNMLENRKFPTVIKTLQYPLAGKVSIEFDYSVLSAYNNQFKVPFEIYNNKGEIISKIFLNDVDGDQKSMKIITDDSNILNQKGVEVNYFPLTDKMYKVKVVIDTQKQTQRVYLYDKISNMELGSALDVPLLNKNVDSNINSFLLSVLVIKQSTFVDPYTRTMIVDNVAICANEINVSDIALSGETLSTSSSINSITVNKNDPTITGTKNLMIGIYDNNNKLIGIKRIALDVGLLSNGINVIQKSIDISTYTNKSAIKVFVFNSLNDINPISLSLN